MIEPKRRIIKPTFFASAEVGNLSYPARLLYIALWTMADREGRLERDHKVIKHYSLPYDESAYSCSGCHLSPELKVSELLNELAQAGFIQFYGNGKYIHIPGLPRQQKFHANERPSELPEPPPLNESQLDLLEKSQNQHSNGIGNGNGNGNDPPVEIIIGHLNRIAGSQFKPTSIPTIQRIRRLWRDGWRVPDFEYVHIVKTTEWQGGKFAKFIRPKTLYSQENFESYRNQKQAANLPERLTKNIQAAAEYLRRKGIGPHDASNSIGFKDSRALPDRSEPDPD